MKKEPETKVIKEVKECSAGKPFTAETFLEYLCPSHDRWQPTREDRDASNYGLPHGTAWIFRGMSNVTWKLIPSLWRECNDQVLALVELEQKNDSVEERLRAYRCVYKRLRDEFKIRADLLGLLPAGGSECKSTTNLVFEQKTTLDGLAQHHGIPTHLLDWTLNPLVAAFFAAEKAENIPNFCVYAFNITRVAAQIPTDTRNPGKIPRIQVLILPFSASSYFRSQLGLFTHMPESGDYFMKHGRWPDLESAFKEWSKEPGNAQHFPILQKIILPSSEKPKLLELLRRRGITRAHLMPTLDNVGQEVMDESGRIISSR